MRYNIDAFKEGLTQNPPVLKGLASNKDELEGLHKKAIQEYEQRLEKRQAFQLVAASKILKATIVSALIGFFIGFALLSLTRPEGDVPLLAWGIMLGTCGSLFAGLAGLWGRAIWSNIWEEKTEIQHPLDEFKVKNKEVGLTSQILDPKVLLLHGNNVSNLVLEVVNAQGMVINREQASAIEEAIDEEGSWFENQRDKHLEQKSEAFVAFQKSGQSYLAQ